jgi:hypothetical protein
VTRSHLRFLDEKGATLCRPDAETLAALHTLRSLLSDAASGDLHQEGGTLGPRTVQEWLLHNMDPCLTSLFGEIVGVSEPEGESDPEVMPALLEALRRKRILTLEAMAAEIDLPAPVIEETVLKHPGRIGWLQGPPKILFDYKPPETLASGERDGE